MNSSQLQKEASPTHLVGQESKQIIAKFRMYFTAEQKMKLEEMAEKSDERIYQQFVQYQKDQDLNGFIQSLQQLTAEKSIGKKSSFDIEQNAVDLTIEQLTKQGMLSIDEFLLDIIN